MINVTTEGRKVALSFDETVPLVEKIDLLWSIMEACREMVSELGTRLLEEDAKFVKAKAQSNTKALISTQGS